MEVVAALALAVNVTNVVDYGWKVWKRFEDMRKSVGETPEVFRNLETTLPLLLSSLEKHKLRAQTSDIGEAADTENQALSRVCDGCALQISLLDEIFDACIPRAEHGAIERAKRVLFSIRNEENVRKISVSMDTYLRALSYHIALAGPVSISTEQDSGHGNFWIPFDRDPDFVGRTTLVADIEEAYKHTSTVSLNGIGGVGKTQIAIEYCYRMRVQNPKAHVLWAYCHTMGRFQQSCSDIAARLGLSDYGDATLDKRLMLKNYLERLGTRPWLMVLDNLDDIDMVVAPTSEHSTQEFSQISTFIPISEYGQILVTTRDQRIGLRLSGNKGSLDVEPLLGESACQMLQNRLTHATTYNLSSLAQICEHLENLPLAISQAAAHMNQYYVSPDDYIKSIKTSDVGTIELLDEDLGDRRRDLESSSSIGRTWEVTFRRLMQQDRRAANMLAFMSTVESQNIPIQLMSHLELDRLQCTKALGVLQALSLVRSQQLADGSTLFSMHRLVQRYTRKWLTSEGSYEKHRELAVQILSSPELGTPDAFLLHRLRLLQEYRPTAKTTESYGAMFDLILETEMARTSGVATLQICSSTFAQTKTELAIHYPKYEETAYRLASLCHLQGLYEDCILMLKPLTEKYLSAPFQTPEDLQAASPSCSLLGKILAQICKEDEASVIYSRLLHNSQLLQTEFPEHQEISSFKCDMAELLAAIGDDEACLRLCEELAPSIAFQEDAFQSRYHAVRGWAKWYKGHYEEAEEDLLKGLRMLQEATPTTSGVLAMLELAYQLVKLQIELEKLEDAKRTAREVMKVADETFSNDDPRKAFGIYLLVELYVEEGNLDRAQSLIEDFIHTMASTQFSLSDSYVHAFRMLTSIFYLKKDPASALASHRKEIEVTARAFGSSNNRTLHAKHLYASYLSELDEKESAMTIYQEVVDQFDYEAFGGAWIIRTWHNLSYLAFNDFNRIDDAITYASRCVQETSRWRGKETEEYMGNLWRYTDYLSRRSLTDAILLLRNEQDFFMTSTKDNRMCYYRVQGYLSVLLHRDKQYEESETLRNEVLQWGSEADGAAALAVADMLYDLSVGAYDQGRIAESCSLLKDCHDIEKRILKATDPQPGRLGETEELLTFFGEELERLKKRQPRNKSRLTSFRDIFRGKPGLNAASGSRQGRAKSLIDMSDFRSNPIGAGRKQDA